MRYLVFILVIFIIFPMNVLSQNPIPATINQVVLSNAESDQYKSFLKEMRKSDRKRCFEDYKEARNHNRYKYQTEK